MISNSKTLQLLPEASLQAPREAMVVKPLKRRWEKGRFCLTSKIKPSHILLARHHMLSRYTSMTLREKISLLGQELKWRSPSLPGRKPPNNGSNNKKAERKALSHHYHK